VGQGHVSLSHTHSHKKNHLHPHTYTQRVGSNRPGRQPVVKGTGWVEDFNPSARSGPSRSACQLDGLARPDPLACFKKIK